MTAAGAYTAYNMRYKNYKDYFLFIYLFPRYQFLSVRIKGVAASLPARARPPSAVSRRAGVGGTAPYGRTSPDTRTPPLSLPTRARAGWSAA